MLVHNRRSILMGVLVLVACACGARTVGAQTLGDVGASECCVTMLFPVGARALALGGALTARPSPDGLFTNPAAIANMAAGELRVHSGRTDIENATSITAFLRVRRAGTLAFSFRTVDNGDIETRDEQGNPTGTLRVADQALYATFATEIISGVRAGVTYNLYDCAGVCGQPAFKATTHAVDFGVQLQPRSIPHLELGAAINHAGLKLQVNNADQAALTPARIKLGGAYEILHLFSSDTATALWASLDGTSSWHEGVPTQVGTGLELSLNRTLFLRGGWSSGTGRGTGTALGLGFVYQRFDISVAKAFVSADEDPPIQVSFAVRF